MGRTIEEKIDNIERYIMISAKNILTADEAATMLDMKVSMIYSLTSRRKIPFYKPNGKKIFFKKDELRYHFSSLSTIPGWQSISR